MDLDWIYEPVENGLDLDYDFNPAGPTDYVTEVFDT